MRSIVIFATVTTTADAVANVLLPKNGRIKSCRWVAAFDGPADNARCNLELATRSTSQFTVNDSTNVLGALDIYNNLLTSGGNANAFKYQEFVDFPVASGERIYLHALVVGTVSCAVRVFIDVMD